MRKEVIYAVIFGVILGTVILYGINLANNSATSLNQNSDSPTPSANISNTPTPLPSELTISYPLDHAVIQENSVVVKGSAKPQSQVAVIGESDEIIVETGTDGTFSAKIALIGGENVITVTSIDKELKTTESSISVIYSASLSD